MVILLLHKPKTVFRVRITITRAIEIVIRTLFIEVM